jgi:hypothetical protein
MLNHKIETRRSQSRDMKIQSTSDAARAIVQAELDRRDAHILALKAARIENEGRGMPQSGQSRAATLLHQNARSAPKLKQTSARSRGR